MKTISLLLAFVGLAVAVTGCGTVSNVSAVPGKQVDLRKYDRVIVRDFVDGVSTNAKPRLQARKKVEMAIRTKSFPDRIAVELGAKNVFREVVRSGEPDTNTLVVCGTITRYEEGDATARLMVGMGAGSSYFDADVEFRDGATSELLANQKVNKNSWVLGGTFASAQTPEEFMAEAARRLSDNISTAKTTGTLPPPQTTAKSESAETH